MKKLNIFNEAKREYLTTNPGLTKKLGEEFAKEIGQLSLSPRKRAFIIALDGELGGGKTTFLQGFAKGLGVKEKILSPTFVILKRFKITEVNGQKPKTKNTDRKYENFYHIDCYRIREAKEILGLGFKEIIENPQNIIAIEWAERIKKILPKNALMLEFEFVDQKTRRIRKLLGRTLSL